MLCLNCTYVLGKNRNQRVYSDLFYVTNDIGYLDSTNFKYSLRSIETWKESIKSLKGQKTLKFLFDQKIQTFM